MSQINSTFKDILKIGAINLMLLVVLLGCLEISTRLIYPEFVGHLHSKSLTLGKKMHFTTFHGFQARSPINSVETKEDYPYVIVFGDSISNGYGLAFEDIWWRKLETLLEIKGEKYKFLAISGFGNSFVDNLSNINAFLSSAIESDAKISKIIYQFNFNDINTTSTSSSEDKNWSQTSLIYYLNKLRHEQLNKSVFMRVAQHHLKKIIRKTEGECEERLLHALGPYTWSFGSRPFQTEAEQAWENFLVNIIELKKILSGLNVKFEIVVSPIISQIDPKQVHPYTNYLNYDFSCATIDPLKRLEVISEKNNIRLYNPIDYIVDGFEARLREGNFVPFFFTADENHITPIASSYLAEYVALHW